MIAARRTICAIAAGTAFVFGCAVDPNEEGWFTPPAQKTILLEPSAAGLEYEQVEIAVATDRTIRGWFIPADGARATVLLSHGAVFNRSLHQQYYLVLHYLGYNVMVYDYQGYGDSPGEANLGTLTPDADAALQYVQSMARPGTDRIVLFGVSMGTLPTLALAARLPDRVVGVILDSPFLPESLPAWSLPLLGVPPDTEVIDDVIAAYPELDPHRYIEQITLPKLFIHSRQDVVTPFAGAEEMYQLAPEPKQFVEVLGGHTPPPLLDPLYIEGLSEFLRDVTVEQ